MDNLNSPPLFLSDHLSEAERAWLLAFPNVTDTSIGLKMKNGAFTHEWALVVYVTQKVSENQLPEGSVLPQKVAGLPVDVQEDLDSAHFLISQGDNLDLTRVRPLRSGITISTFSASDHGGTLGCFAIRNSDQKKVLVSNYHVLFRNRGLPGMDQGENRVYQPTTEEQNQIAIVPNGTGSIGGSVDCAFAVLVEEGSCCCCKHTIPHENKSANILLVGVASAQVGQKVFKTGAKTGSTVGKVVNTNKAIDGAVSYADYSLPAGDSFIFSNLIMIVFWDETAANFDPTRPFAEAGDSGSVIYNENHEIVGLHFGSHFNPATGRHFSMACHIELVESQLNVTIPGTRHYVAAIPAPLPPDLAALNDPVPSDEVSLAGAGDYDQVYLERWWQQTQPWLVRTDLGHKYLSLINAHIYEVLHLVNKNRDVMVTWQRGRGPALVAAVARSIRHEDYKIPRLIEGISPGELVARMGAVLMKHGSQELKETIQVYLPWIIQTVEQIDSVPALLEIIAENAALQHS